MNNVNMKQDPADDLLFSAYRQWIDLARLRELDQDSTPDVRKRYLWHDDDNPWHIRHDQSPEDIISPILATESLLSFLLPTIALKPYSLFPINPDSGVSEDTATRVREALAKLSGEGIPTGIQLPLRKAELDIVLKTIGEYYDYISHNQAFRFGGHSYFVSSDQVEHPSAEILALDVTDAYALGLSTALRVLRIVRTLLDSPSTDDTSRLLCEDIRKKASQHLMQTLNGLENSFAVNMIDSTTWDHSNGQDYLWQDIKDTPEMHHIRDRLRAYGYITDYQRAFECGWSWGPVPSRATTDALDDRICAENAPYLYFTWTAVNALADLDNQFLQADELIALELPDGPTLSTAIRLKALSRITAHYWSLLAQQRRHSSSSLGELSYSSQRIYQIPWSTTDSDETEYYSLYVLGIVQHNPDTGIDPEATIDLLEELAIRGRITTRPLLEARQGVAARDVEMIVRRLHKPGTTLDLFGRRLNASNPNVDTTATWRIYDFAPLLLKAAAMTRLRTTSHATRRRTIVLISHLLQHLDLRRCPKIDLGDTAEDFDDEYGMWDSIGPYLPKAVQQQTPSTSWYFTQRTIDALVTLLYSEPIQLAAPSLEALLAEIIAELDSRRIGIESIRGRTQDAPASTLATILSTIVADVR